MVMGFSASACEPGKTSKKTLSITSSIFVCFIFSSFEFSQPVLGYLHQGPVSCFSPCSLILCLSCDTEICRRREASARFHPALASAF
jgi:hypothetical protein